MDLHDIKKTCKIRLCCCVLWQRYDCKYKLHCVYGKYVKNLPKIRQPKYYSLDLIINFHVSNLLTSASHIRFDLNVFCVCCRLRPHWCSSAPWGRTSTSCCCIQPYWLWWVVLFTNIYFHFLNYRHLHVDFRRLPDCSSRLSDVMFTCTQDWPKSSQPYVHNKYSTGGVGLLHLYFCWYRVALCGSVEGQVCSIWIL